MSQPFRFRTNFATRLAADIGSGDASFTLTSVPDDLLVGRYSFRFGANDRSSEWLAADYPGTGAAFYNTERVGEGGTSPRAWPAGTPVAHVITGESLNALRNAAVSQALQAVNPYQYVRPAGMRAYLAQTFR